MSMAWLVRLATQDSRHPRLRPQSRPHLMCGPSPHVLGFSTSTAGRRPHLHRSVTTRRSCTSLLIRSGRSLVGGRIHWPMHCQRQITREICLMRILSSIRDQGGLLVGGFIQMSRATNRTLSRPQPTRSVTPWDLVTPPPKIP